MLLLMLHGTDKGEESVALPITGKSDSAIIVQVKVVHTYTVFAGYTQLFKYA